MQLQLLFCLSVVAILSSAAKIVRTGCTISVNEDLSKPQPLLLLQNNATTDIRAFPLPINANGDVKFAQNQTIDIACPGGFIIEEESHLDKSTAPARCLLGDRFMIEGKSVPFKSITCSKIPKHTARYSNRTCAKTFAEIEIGFNIDERFIRHIQVCFDKTLQHALYSKSVLSSSIGGYQRSFPRPDFITGDFYDVKPDTIKELYTRKRQQRTINTILGLPENDESVISETSNRYLARGHYTPKTDYVFGAQQRLTFYYLNAAPQWQAFNGGNWFALESNYRKLAEERQLDIVVYTGSFGTATLPDINRKHQELYLWVYDTKRALPIPKLTFKVLYEPKSKAGVALITLNNPYKGITEKDIICKDVCNKIKWLTWDRFNVSKGYSYCCEIPEFRRTVTFLPDFKVELLLM